MPIIWRIRKMKNRQILIGPDYWGDLDLGLIEQLGFGIFPCGACSTEVAAVYHNTVGTHRHILDETGQPNVAYLMDMLATVPQPNGSLH